jgi:hypothetical protein
MKARQFVASLLLAICSAACPALHAQDATNPQWLLKYQCTECSAGNKANSLMWDKRFKPFINHHLPQKPKFRGWGKPEPMGEIASELFGVSGLMHAGNDHYFVVDGCMAHACGEDGMLWVDFTNAPPLVVFAVLDLGGDDIGCKLYLFTSRKLSARDLPQDLRASVTRWTAKLPGASDENAELIARAVIVDPNEQNDRAGLNAIGVAPAAQEKSEKQ